jgi:hypothetical protein
MIICITWYKRDKDTLKIDTLLNDSDECIEITPESLVSIHPHKSVRTSANEQLGISKFHSHSFVQCEVVHSRSLPIQEEFAPAQLQQTQHVNLSTWSMVQESGFFYSSNQLKLMRINNQHASMLN